MTPLEILHETNAYVVVNKPAGPITEDNPFEPSNIEALLRGQLSTPRPLPFLGVVHRLDRVTSGVLIFAKKRSTLKTLNRLFSERSAHKSYLALTTSAPPKTRGTLTNPLITDKKAKRARITTAEEPGAKLAQLGYEIIGHIDGKYLWLIQPKTGRFHQIRAQLAHLGCPIVGDHHYGSTEPAPKNCIALHAYSLSFDPWPLAGPKEFTAGPPATAPWPDISGLLASLK